MSFHIFKLLRQLILPYNRYKLAYRLSATFYTKQSLSLITTTSTNIIQLILTNLASTLLMEGVSHMINYQLIHFFTFLLLSTCQCPCFIAQ